MSGRWWALLWSVCAVALATTVSVGVWRYQATEMARQEAMLAVGGVEVCVSPDVRIVRFDR